MCVCGYKVVLNHRAHFSRPCSSVILSRLEKCVGDIGLQCGGVFAAFMVVLDDMSINDKNDQDDAHIL